MKQYRLIIHNEENKLNGSSLLIVDCINGDGIKRLYTIFKIGTDEKLLLPDITEDQFLEITGKRKWDKGESIHLSEYAVNVLINAILHQ